MGLGYKCPDSGESGVMTLSGVISGHFLVYTKDKDLRIRKTALRRHSDLCSRCHKRGFFDTRVVMGEVDCL